MKKIGMLLTLLSLYASDKECTDSLLYSADIVDIKKIQQKYPHLEIHKVENVALCYNPTIWEKFHNYFVDPKKISNKDHAYLFTTQEIIQDLCNARCITNVRENHS